MPKKEKRQRQKAQCGCCGARMEIAEELVPDQDGKVYCENCGPRPTRMPYCPKCENLR